MSFASDLDDVKAPFRHELLVQQHLKPVYARGREYTMLYTEPVGNDRHRPPEFDGVNGGEGDLFVGSVAHGHDTASGCPFVAAQLKIDAELRMSVGEGGSPDAGAYAVQLIDHFGAGQPLDFIAQDQDVDAGENRAVGHGGAPRDIGVGQVKGEYTRARPDAKQ
jgi:hypothetical protein